MKIQDVFIEGSTKKLYLTDEAGKAVIEFVDTLPPWVSSKKAAVRGKGKINLEISSYIFEYLSSYNVPTHYLNRIDDRKMLVKKLDIIPIQMQVWNVATGTLVKRIGLKEGTLLETPVLELYLKNAKLKNPLINDYHAYTLGLCERSEMNAIIRIGTKVNAVLKSLFSRKRLTLAHFTLEFGRYGNQMVLGDEISADTLSVWDTPEPGKFDKKIFQLRPENARPVYTKLRDRLLK